MPVPVLSPALLGDTGGFRLPGGGWLLGGPGGWCPLRTAGGGPAGGCIGRGEEEDTDADEDGGFAPGGCIPLLGGGALGIIEAVSGTAATTAADEGTGEIPGGGTIRLPLSPPWALSVVLNVLLFRICPSLSM